MRPSRRTRAGAVTAPPRRPSSRPATSAAEEPAVRIWWVDPGDLRTHMHQQAFPGEDISDRPLPETIVPGFLRLVRERMASGRYRAADLMPAGASSHVGGFVMTVADRTLRP